MGSKVMTRNAISFHQKVLSLFQKYLLRGEKCLQCLHSYYHLYGVLSQESGCPIYSQT